MLMPLQWPEEGHPAGGSTFEAFVEAVRDLL